MLFKGVLLLECLYSHNTDVAQLVEHWSPKPGVGSSNLSIRANKKKYYKVAGIKNYIEEIVNELTNKVSWPTWQDLQTSSIIVLVTSVILALIIWLMDYVFGIWPRFVVSHLSYTSIIQYQCEVVVKVHEDSFLIYCY